MVGFATVIKICSTPSQTVRALSKRAPSTTRTSLRFRISDLRDQNDRDDANCVRPPNVPRSLTGLSNIVAVGRTGDWIWSATADLSRLLISPWRFARLRERLRWQRCSRWADQGSSFLLEFIAQGIGEHPLLVLITYRDGEVAAPLARTLGELARLGVTRIELNGLTLDGTARLMANVAGRRPAARVVRQIHARTDGNRSL